MKIKDYWQQFLVDTNRDLTTTYFEAFYFGSNKQSAQSLSELVLTHNKTATCSAYAQYHLTDSRLPQVGDLSIVTDWEGNPLCVIETTDVTYMKFKEMTYDICKREGEDDSLVSWQNNHIDFFNEIGKEMGFTFSWDMDIVFEDFKMIYE